MFNKGDKVVLLDVPAIRRANHCRRYTGHSDVGWGSEYNDMVGCLFTILDTSIYDGDTIYELHFASHNTKWWVEEEWIAKPCTPSSDESTQLDSFFSEF